MKTLEQFTTMPIQGTQDMFHRFCRKLLLFIEITCIVSCSLSGKET